MVQCTFVSLYSLLYVHVCTCIYMYMHVHVCVVLPELQNELSHQSTRVMDLEQELEVCRQWGGQREREGEGWCEREGGRHKDTCTEGERKREGEAE